VSASLLSNQRLIRIDSAGHTGCWILNLADIAIWSDGVAKNMTGTPVVMSTWQYNDGGPPSAFVDGFANTYIHTQYSPCDPNPWVFIDVGDRTFDQVVVTNRMNCCQPRIKGARISFVDNENGAYSAPQYFLSGAAEFTFSFPEGMGNVGGIAVSNCTEGYTTSGVGSTSIAACSVCDIGYLRVDSSCVTEPTLAPTQRPTPNLGDPTEAPTLAPTAAPTAAPTQRPTPSLGDPTEAPTLAPTAAPTAAPTQRPTPSLGDPTEAPTLAPTAAPTAAPTQNPTNACSPGFVRDGVACIPCGVGKYSSIFTVTISYLFSWRNFKPGHTRSSVPSNKDGLINVAENGEWIVYQNGQWEMGNLIKKHWALPGPPGEYPPTGIWQNIGGTGFPPREGTRISDPSAAVCLHCPAGKYCDVEGATECTTTLSDSTYRLTLLGDSFASTIFAEEWAGIVVARS